SMPRETAQPLQRREIDQLILQDFVGWMRIIGHLPFSIVSNDWCAAQPLEQAHLNLLRPKRNEPVETCSKTIERLSRQTHNEISMDVHARMLAEKSQIVLQSLVILPPLNQRSHFFIEGLNSNLKLQGPWGKFGYDLAQRFGQPVRDHFKMEK